MIWFGLIAIFLATVDVYLTRKILNKYGYAKEQFPFIKFLYEKLGDKAFIAHGLLWFGFISLPLIFQSGGTILGYSMLIAIFAYSIKRNLFK